MEHNQSMKVCVVCGETKSIDEMYDEMAGGFICEVCHRRFFEEELSV